MAKMGVAHRIRGERRTVRNDMALKRGNTETNADRNTSSSDVQDGIAMYLLTLWRTFRFEKLVGCESNKKLNPDVREQLRKLSGAKKWFDQVALDGRNV